MMRKLTSYVTSPFQAALNRDKARDSKPKPSSLGKNLPQDLDPEILTFYGLWVNPSPLLVYLTFRTVWQLPDLAGQTR